MVVQLQVLNLVGASSLLKCKDYILDSAVVKAKFALDLSLRHAKNFVGVDNLDSVSVGYSVVFDLAW